MSDPVSLAAVHARTFGNRKRLERSEQAGCFHCEAIYPTTEVVRWIDHGTTAVCPRCGIDSVIPSHGLNLTLDLLALIKERYFAVWT